MRQMRVGAAALVWIVIAMLRPVAAQSVYADRVEVIPCLITTGSGAPSGGSTCDTYLDTASGQIWTKIGSGWSPVSVLVPTQANGHVLAGPTSGADAAPTFRFLVTNDIPSTLNATTFTGTITITGNVVPDAADTRDIGTATLPWRQSFVSQMNATLFAKETQTLYGGWLAVSKNAGVFAAAVSSGATTVDFGQSMTANQFVLVRAADTGGTITAEYFKVGTLVSGTTYNVTRNLSGAGAKNWALGTPYQVRGVSGDGWIELEAFDTPRMSIFQQGSAYNNSTEQIRIGYLTGMPNSSSGIGFYMGDATNFLRWDGTTLKLGTASLSIDNNGVAITPKNSNGIGDDAHGYVFPGTLISGGKSAIWGGEFSVTGENQTWMQIASTTSDLVGNALVTLVASSGFGDPTSISLQNGSVFSGGSVAEIDIRADDLAIIAPIRTTSSIKERSRTVAMGDWTTRTFSAGNFAAAGVGATATVTSGETFADGYMRVGSTTWVTCTVIGFTISGAAADYIEVALPSGTVGQRFDMAAHIRSNGTEETGIVVGIAGESFLRVYRGSLGTWPTGTTNNDIRFAVPVPIS